MAYLFCNPGNGGRLGNHLFTIAACIGIARANNMQPLFHPNWQYRHDFKIPDEMFGYCDIAAVHVEAQYHYEPVELDGANNVELKGFYQSEKYWQDSIEEVRQCLQFSDVIQDGMKDLVKKGNTAVSIRRGDFVGNQNYYQLPIKYYLLALMEVDNDANELSFFSDDMSYCKHHFGSLPNAFFSEGLRDVEQLYLMSKCESFVISNSTFSWWGAYLGDLDGAEVARPKYNLAGPLAERNNEKDYWPERWKLVEHEDRKIPLQDVTFTIPIQIDHFDRKQNLDLVVCMLQRDFETNIIVGEVGTDKATYMAQYCEYIRFNYRDFHRTKMLNEMARQATTDIVFNYDCDVLLPPLQIMQAVHLLRSKSAQMVYPYDGRFCRVVRNPWFSTLEKSLDTGSLAGSRFPGDQNEWGASVGGCVAVNKKAFFRSGGENEHFISYGPEDVERFERWQKLGYTVKRIAGPLYHIEHYRGIDSGTSGPFFHENHNLLKSYQAMNAQQLREVVDSWPWASKAPKELGYAGGWKAEDALKEHAFSLQLAAALSNILDKKLPVYDLGCGPGFYLAFLKQRKFKGQGFEYTDTTEISLFDKITRTDLTEPLQLKEPGQIICLEVGEHIPGEHEKTLLDNICSHAAGKIVLSWAIPGQEGFGHVNCQPNSYIISRLQERGWELNVEQSDLLRDNCAGCGWFEKSIMVFDKL